jgi:hypothetical protein
MATAALLLVGLTATAAAYGGAGSDAGTARQRGAGSLPFSIADLGWLLLAASLLLILSVGLHQLARKRRRALRSVARERTNP